MRYQGRLKKWNAERGYGFIVASDSGQDIFVHITAFPRDGRMPMQGDELIFEVEPDGKGKKYTATCCASGILRKSANWLRGTSITRTMRVVISATRMPRGSPAGRKIWMVWGRAIRRLVFSY
jgi:cold shock CspA family protein